MSWTFQSKNSASFSYPTRSDALPAGTFDIGRFDVSLFDNDQTTYSSYSNQAKNTATYTFQTKN